MKRYNASAWSQAQGLGPGAEMETAVPARPAGFVSDVLVPVTQAAVSGVLVGGLVTFLAWRSDYGGDLASLGIGVALAVAVVSWVWLLADTRKLLWALERFFGGDFDGDQHVGPPEERLVVVNAAAGQLSQAQDEKALRRSQFSAFVQRLPAMGTGMDAWEAELGRDKYREFRDTLIRCGWARWKREKGKRRELGGWELTTPVEDILERVSW